jgi:hypothetical protein
VLPSSCGIAIADSPVEKIRRINALHMIRNITYYTDIFQIIVTYA